MSSTTFVGERSFAQIHLESSASLVVLLPLNRWPVTSAQESMIKVQHLINEDGVVRIQPDYGKPLAAPAQNRGVS